MGPLSVCRYLLFWVGCLLSDSVKFYGSFVVVLLSENVSKCASICDIKSRQCVPATPDQSHQKWPNSNYQYPKRQQFSRRAIRVPQSRSAMRNYTLYVPRTALHRALRGSAPRATPCRKHLARRLCGYRPADLEMGRVSARYLRHDRILSIKIRMCGGSSTPRLPYVRSYLARPPPLFRSVE